MELTPYTTNFFIWAILYVQGFFRWFDSKGGEVWIKARLSKGEKFANQDYQKLSKGEKFARGFDNGGVANMGRNMGK